MKLLFSKVDFSVLRFSPENVNPSEFQELMFRSQNWISLTRTDAELSVVCSTEVADQIRQTPQSREDGWISFAVEGPLDFSLTGVMASIAKPLADSGISLFAISTFDTDIILIKKHLQKQAQVTLQKSGFAIVS